VQNIGSAIQDVANCVVAGLCDVTELFGGACGCSQPPTTVAANCAPILGKCGDPYIWVDGFDLTKCNDPKYSNDIHCQCNAAGILATGPAPGGVGSTEPLYVVINTPGGQEILEASSSSFSCGTTYSCFCPNPMSLQHTPGIVDPNSGNTFEIWYCQCPPGQIPDPTGNGCQYPPFDPCPFPQIPRNGKCMEPCAKNEVMTPDGACCDPTQVTSCGTCCPPGTTPNLADGSCYPPQKIQ
jgi:hypothetical protein